MLFLESIWLRLRRKFLIWYYECKLRKMSYVQKLIWADNHPLAKKMMGLRGFSELSLIDKAALGIIKIDEDVENYR